MEFQVPQFIEIEDRVVGPFTIKQFIYLAGAGGISVLLVLFLPFWVGAVLAVPFLGFGFALAFVKINEKPFDRILEAAFGFTIREKLYLWKKEGVKRTLDASAVITPVPAKKEGEGEKPVTMETLRLLARKLDKNDVS